MSTYSNAIFKKLISMTWPILIGQLAGISYAVLDTMMIGNYSAVGLQAMSLGSAIFVTISISLMGVIHAIIPIIAQLIGARKNAEVGIFWGQGTWLAFILSLLVGLLMLFPDMWLSISGEVSQVVRDEITIYLRICYLALPAMMMYRAVYAICTSSQNPRHIMYISIVGTLSKALLNWILIFGKLGLPALGSAGAGLSTLIVSWITYTVGLFIIFKNPVYDKFLLHLGRPKFKPIKQILNLGIPMGGSYFVEISIISFMALFVAREGIYVSGAHQILTSFVSVMYMIPQSISICTSALAAQAIGARKYILSHNTVKMGTYLVLAGYAILALTVILFKVPLVDLYTNNTDVAHITLIMISIIPFFHLADALQCYVPYILRAHKIATVPFVTQSIILLGIGLAGGYYFGFGAGRGNIKFLTEFIVPNAPIGIASMWTMITISLYICTAILGTWYYFVIKELIPKSRKNNMPFYYKKDLFKRKKP